MGQIYNIEQLDKKFIALGNREMLIRRIYWPMEEFLKGERELTIGMICSPINNSSMTASWQPQTLTTSDNNSFYFGLKSVNYSSSMGYEFLPYDSGSSFVGIKSSKNGTYLLPRNDGYSWQNSMTGMVGLYGKSSMDSTFIASQSYLSTIIGCNKSSATGYPTLNTNIVATYKYNPRTNDLYVNWGCIGMKGWVDARGDLLKPTVSSIDTKSQLLSILNYDTSYITVSSSATMSVNLTNDDVMNFFVFWPFTTARLAIQAYGWQLT